MVWDVHQSLLVVLVSCRGANCNFSLLATAGVGVEGGWRRRGHNSTTPPTNGNGGAAASISKQTNFSSCFVQRVPRSSSAPSRLLSAKKKKISGSETREQALIYSISEIPEKKQKHLRRLTVADGTITTATSAPTLLFPPPPGPSQGRGVGVGQCRGRGNKAKNKQRS